MKARHGIRDRRERLICLTPAGEQIERDLFDDLHDNVMRAYHASGGGAVRGFWIVLQHLIGEEGREQFRAMSKGL